MTETGNLLICQRTHTQKQDKLIISHKRATKSKPKPKTNKKKTTKNTKVCCWNKAVQNIFIFLSTNSKPAYLDGEEAEEEAEEGAWNHFQRLKHDYK